MGIGCLLGLLVLGKHLILTICTCLFFQYYSSFRPASSSTFRSGPFHDISSPIQVQCAPREESRAISPELPPRGHPLPSEAILDPAKDFPKNMKDSDTRIFAKNAILGASSAYKDKGSTPEKVYWPPGRIIRDEDPGKRKVRVPDRFRDTDFDYFYKKEDQTEKKQIDLTQDERTVKKRFFLFGFFLLLSETRPTKIVTMKSPVEQDFTKAWAQLIRDHRSETLLPWRRSSSHSPVSETMLKRSLNALQALESPLLGAYWYSIKLRQRPLQSSWKSVAWLHIPFLQSQKWITIHADIVSFFANYDPTDKLLSKKFYDVAFLAIWEALHDLILQYLLEGNVEPNDDEIEEPRKWFMSDSKEEEDSDADVAQNQEEEPMLPDWVTAYAPPTVTTTHEVPKAGKAPIAPLLEIYLNLVSLPEAEIPRDLDKLLQRYPEWEDLLYHPFIDHLTKVSNSAVWYFLLHLLYDWKDANCTIRQLAQEVKGSIGQRVAFFASLP